MAKRQVVGDVAVDLVGDVEVRVATAGARADDIADESIAAVGNRVCGDRDVIDGVRPGVVDVVGQTEPGILVHSDEKTVVAREALVGVDGVFSELRRHTDVCRQGVSTGQRPRSSRKGEEPVGEVTARDIGCDVCSELRVVGIPRSHAGTRAKHVLKPWLGRIGARLGPSGLAGAGLPHEVGVCLRHRLPGDLVREVDELGHIGLSHQPAAEAPNVVCLQDEALLELMLHAKGRQNRERSLEVRIDGLVELAIEQTNRVGVGGGGVIHPRIVRRCDCRRRRRGRGVAETAESRQRLE